VISETGICIEVTDLPHAKADVLLGEYFLIATEWDISLAQGTVWRFGKEDKTKAL